jgi:LuxR family transcriptional regulator, quorum-sensing system regulator CviR
MEIRLSKEDAELLTRSDLVVLIDIVNQALKVNCGEELKELWPRIAEFADLDGGIFGVSKAQKKEGTVQLDLVTFGIDPHWLEEYRNSQLAEQDPMVQATLETQRPISWREAAKLAIKIDADAFRCSKFRHHAKQSGLEHGYIFSKHSQYHNRVLAVTAVTTGSRPLTDYQSRLLEILLPHLNEILIRQGFSKAPELSAREQEVLQWATVGKSNWDVAQILNISERTVKFHLRNIYRKLEVNNRSHAVAEALRIGAVELE